MSALSVVRSLGLLVFLTLWSFAKPSAHGQGTAPAGAAAANLDRDADAAFDRRQYPLAIDTYQKLIQGYPNAEVVPDARFHLAYAQFLTGKYDPAAAGLRGLIGAPTTPPEMLEQAVGLLPQVLAQQAAALPPNDGKRKEAFESAVREYDNFIGKYPRSAALETALYGRAIADYQLARYDAAAKDLRQNLASFPNSETVLDSAFLLSITVATQANLSLAKDNPTPAETEAASRGYTEAEKLLNDIIAKRSDLSLANDAQLQLGETLLAHAAAVPAGARDAMYERALAAYRNVEPKEGMIAAQTARVIRLNEARIAELRKGAAADRGRARLFDEARLREQGKLEALQAKEDPVLTARLKGGAVYCNLQRFDEARVLMSALLPSARKPEDEKLALYYTTLSYAGQKLVDKAVAAYQRFQAKFAGDPLAENLPLVISGLFTEGATPDPARANQYLSEFAKLYPKSRLRETALLQQATTADSLGRHNDALKLLDTFLAGKPRRELAATGELARGRVMRNKKDYNGALAAFKKVRDTYKDRPEGEEAAFWVGNTLLEKKDAAGSVAELKAFTQAFPQSRLQPDALLTLGLAQAQAGAKDQAVATLTDLAARFPKSPEAANAYLAQANIYLSDRKFADMVRTLSEFVDKNPENDQAFAATEQIATVQEQQNQADAAAAAYDQFLSRQAESPQAARALGRLSGLWLRTARKMGSYSVLGAPQREVWKADIGHSIAASERQLESFPDAPSTALGLNDLLECQRLLMEAKLKTEGEVIDYFQKLADRYQDKPGARGRILFRMVSLTAEKNPARALDQMKEAYDPAVVYSPQDMDLYVGLLLPTDPEGVAAVLDKVGQDYPLPPGVPPANAPPDVQEAQALLLYGRGQLANAKGDKAAAVKAFASLKRDYPRSSKVAEADVVLAENLVAQGKPDEALPLLSDVARSPRVPNEVRARGLYLNGEIQAAKGSAEAADAYLKLAAFYPKAAPAPEGLWKGGQALEKQAATLGDTPAAPNGPTKASQLARARKAYQDLVTRYPDSAWTAQAKTRLAALPAQEK